ncbi:putative aminoacrylate peracid reductase RutC [Oxobacter pfennigii]|uniref:Putative aminoacrylate peracid reductase RutC n=1 Tax=Oxobacter pfennigii TaxID=36849 RepID=A0A0P8WYL8_9CLOT|nr:RidA family protein [Oxobacter pfennigii]KPU43515.1 putative aminoacrylate peracid reductase RutC [Oxobacter pfennigii]
MSEFKMKHNNPEGLFSSKVFTQMITVSGNAKTIYIGGQNAVNENGELVGQDDLELQTRQTLKNIGVILASEHASFKNLIKLNIYLLNGCDPRVGLEAFQEYAGEMKNPPLITVLFVAGLARPGCLIEIDGIAAVENDK